MPNICTQAFARLRQGIPLVFQSDGFHPLCLWQYLKGSMTVTLKRILVKIFPQPAILKAEKNNPSHAILTPVEMITFLLIYKFALFLHNNSERTNSA